MTQDQSKQQQTQPNDLFVNFSFPSIEDWRRAAEVQLKGKRTIEDLETTTEEGIEQSILYTRADLSERSGHSSPPGFAPYLRGARPLAAPPRIIQRLSTNDAGFDSAVERAITAGAGGFIIEPSPLTSRRMEPETIAPEHLSQVVVSSGDRDALLIIGCRERVADTMASIHVLPQRPSQHVVLRFDPLADLARLGTLPDDLETSFDAAAKGMPAELFDGVLWAGGELYHAAGGHAAHEVGMVMAVAVEYLRAMEKRDVSPEVTVAKLRFSMAVGTEFFKEIAKLRAARVLWNQILEDCGVAENDRSFWVMSVGSTYYQTDYDPNMNLLRNTTQALAATLGSCDAIELPPFNESIGGSREFADHVARNTQHVLNEEIQAARITDPGGGSYYLETLTHEIARSAWAIFRKIEAAGGMLAALEQGLPQTWLNENHEKRLSRLATRSHVVVGTNLYPNPDDTIPAKKPKEVQPADGRFKTIVPRRLTEQFEHLRTAVGRHRSAGNSAKVVVIGLGAPSGYMQRLDFTLGFFRTGGFEVISETHEIADKGELPGDNGADSQCLVICGHDKTYEAHALPIVRRLRSPHQTADVVLAGRPSDNAFRKKLTDAGVNTFLHAKSDAIALLSDLAKKMGVQL